jgi:hypothetical protein
VVPVCFTEEDILPDISPEHYVVHAPPHMQAQFPCDAVTEDQKDTKYKSSGLTPT